MRSVFAANPHLVDEMAHLLHARAFAAGRLALPAPEPPEAFLVVHTLVTDAGWVSQYPPGHTLLLAVGLMLRAEWLVNPLLGGTSVVLVYLVGRGLYDRKTAVAATFLWAASAWVLFMSSTYMSHVGATTFALAACAVMWAPRHPHRSHALLGGLALAAATAIRPLDGVAAALPIAAWIALRRRWRLVPWLMVGGVPVAVAWGYVNWRLFGDPFTLGYSVLYGPAESLGFHTDPWGQRFNIGVAVSNAAVAIRRLNIYLFEWPIPALLPLVLWALFVRQRRANDLLLAVGALAGPALYFFYWHSGFYPGPRFYYIAAPFLVLATARAWRWGWTRAHRARGTLVRWDVAAAAAGAMVLVWGWVGVLPARFEVYREGLSSMKLHPERTLAARGVREALVLVPESWGSRVIVGLWALGVEPGLAERAYRRLDTCDLDRLLARARTEGWSGPGLESRLENIVATAPEAPPRVTQWLDPTIRLRDAQNLPAACRRELRRDLSGFTLYGPFAWRNPVGLDSGIVFARDLFDENPRLLARYPGWEVWRYAPPPNDPLTMPVLTRIRNGSLGTPPTSP